MPLPVHRSSKDGPDVIILDQLSSRYAPVEFAHRLHAAMSEFSGGCVVCHHHEIHGEISACRACHPPTAEEANLDQPSLKGSYHRQCLGCHREWSHSTACSVCHAPLGGSVKGESETDTSAGTSLAVDNTDIVGVDHPPIEKPGRVIYETDPDVGTYVTFYHDDHVERFGLACRSCHKEENCDRCHDTAAGKEQEVPVPSVAGESLPFAEIHAPCITCHEEDDCQECHRESVRGPFDHALSASWPLGPHHENRTCRECHGEYDRFKTPSRSCDGCHAGWQVGTFNHNATGLSLDETHSEMDCELCHEDRDFSRNPGCENCHDDRAYPNDRPGKVTKPN
jgi:hypothetical protein